MPRYDFKCTVCDHRFETWSSYDARHEVTCPTCQKQESAIVFKATYTHRVMGSSPGQACSPRGGFS
ncbi:FmdB family zinc ribbon protein [Salisediminibacterium beveridgei]|uniref:Putative regulatory protein FmdB zinc ribbon domain-containing protein n=1 Tax=Salisediminibacterium beveridgei TaxID=632773 RepID=A0A1D7QTP6_9BACI|nr:zinc ribbon domain-containing protein [Salisediminibacterium beveridgei]AOM82338.1 hypothetical protein BBEV_0969 [Salisediminibacterium beveridgei]